MDEWQKVGEIGVDAGLCWVGDPCYCVTPDANEHPAQTWTEFCDMLLDDGKHRHATQFKYKAGHDGLGVAVTSGLGDGTYPVYAKIKELPGSGERVHEIRVVFIDPSGKHPYDKGFTSHPAETP